MDLLAAFFYLLFVFLGCKIIRRLLKIPQISNLHLRYILITGCDTGFGNAIAKRLDILGCHIIATCLTESGETELRKSCSNKLHTIHMDVSNTESIKKAYDEVTKILPPGKGLLPAKLLMPNTKCFFKNLIHMRSSKRQFCSEKNTHTITM